jgi:hypothetical protein
MDDCTHAEIEIARSVFKGSAYFKDDKFYLNFTSSSLSTLAYDWSDDYAGHISYSNTNSIYDSKTDECLSSGLSRGVNYNYELEYAVSNINCSKGICVDCSCTNDDPCWACEPSPGARASLGCCGSGCCGGSYPSTCSAFCVDDTCENFNHGCRGVVPCACEDEYDQCEGDYEAVNTGTVTFYDEVRLYNRLGEEVGNIIGASYDPCDPCATWSAPGCHFFAPPQQPPP